MLLAACYKIPVSENILPKAIRILREEFGLVDAILDPLNEQNRCYLVWEDEKSIGRYRVQFTPKIQGYDYITFGYWCVKSRLERRILERDPMKPALERVLSEANEIHEIPHMRYEKSVDEVLAPLT